MGIGRCLGGIPTRRTEPGGAPAVGRLDLEAGGFGKTAGRLGAVSRVMLDSRASADA